MNLLALILALTTLQQLTDAAFRGERIDADAARVEYRLAIAEWMEGQNAGGDAPQATAAAKRAMASVDRAIALDANLAAAHVLRTRIAFILMSHGAMPADEARTLMMDSFAAAKKAAPDDPLVASLESAFLYYGRNQHAEALSQLRKSIERLAARDDEDAKLWLPVVWSWAGIMLIGDGEMEQAHAAFESSLAARPDFAWVKNSMLPMTEVVETGTLPKFARAGWTPIVSDEEGDGKSKTMPDLRGVAWRAQGDRIWFLFSLASAPDPSRIGMNLAFDLDDDPGNGRAWWAGNKSFHYDRLVTVWVARGADGRYRGSSGVADAADTMHGRYATSPAGAVSFGIDGDNLLVGVKRDALGVRGKTRVVATVGSNSDWNDVAPAEGSALFEMH